ncbi:MAG: hypothetical protein VXX11_00950 [Planctomycetota bacterium]|nr:hypothetical protein [Planctomycetota bacterium]
MRNSQDVLEKEIESRPTNVSGRVTVANQLLEFPSAGQYLPAKSRKDPSAFPRRVDLTGR